MNSCIFVIILVNCMLSAYSQNIYFDDVKVIKNPDSSHLPLAKIKFDNRDNENLRRSNEMKNDKNDIQIRDTGCPNNQIPNELSCEECGKTSSKPNVNRIIGGVEAVPGSWPAQVYIEQKYSGNWRFDDGYVVHINATFFCGGSLISRYTVLTAGHCKNTKIDYIHNGVAYVLGIYLNDLYPTWESMFKVYVGYHRRSEMKNPISIDKFLVHESFSSNQLLNDIALIILSKKVITSANIQPACLPPDYSTSYPDYLTPIFAVGWIENYKKGKSANYGNVSNELRNVMLTVYDPEKCEYSIKENWDSQICAGDLSELSSTCSGDSGGGNYILNKQDNSKYILTALTSYGSRECSSKPGVFTRVSYFVKWIKKNWKTGENYGIDASSSTKSSQFLCGMLLCLFVFIFNTGK